MAKKKKTNNSNTSTTRDVTKFCAFWGLVIAGIAALVSFIIALIAKLGVPMGWAARGVGVLNTISQIAFLIAVFIPAYKYSRGKPKLWQGFFWLAVIFVLLGLVGIHLI